jgi:lipopolysaccharide export system protein LptA
MAPLHASLLLTLLCAGATAAAPTNEPRPPQLDDSQPIQLEASSSDFDYKNSRLLFHDVRIAQGGLAIEADQATATGLDFKDSQWLFAGHVKITVPDGSLQSDEAHISFTANLINSADITGTPARFEQKRDKAVARGRAARIVYQPAAGTLRLMEDAWLSDGSNEISGNTLVYNVREQRVLANPGEQGSGRITITINPKKSEQKPEQKPEPRPEPKANP